MEVGSSGYDGGVKIIHINMYIYILYVHDAIDIVILIWERKCIYIYMQKTTKTIYIIYIIGGAWVKYGSSRWVPLWNHKNHEIAQLLVSATIILTSPSPHTT